MQVRADLGAYYKRSRSHRPLNVRYNVVLIHENQGKCMLAQDRLFNLLLIFVAGWLLMQLAPILTPFIAAALLAYVGDPLVDKLETLKISRTLSVVIVFFLLLLILILLFLLLGPMIQTQVGALTEKLPVYMDKLESTVLPYLSNILGWDTTEGFGWGEVFSQYGSKLSEVGTSVLKGVTKTGSGLLGAVLTVLLTPVLAFYLLRDWDVMVARIGALIPRRYQPKVFTLAKESDEALGSFLRGQLMVMLGLATVYSIGLLLIGLENALAIGILSGLVCFVPYLGFIVGIGLAGLTAFAMGGGPMLFLGVLAVYAVGQAIEGTVLTPKFVGENIGLHPVIVIFAVMAGGQLFGFFGILLALPVAAVLSVFLRHFYADYIEDDYHVDDDVLDEETDVDQIREDLREDAQAALNEEYSDRPVSHHDVQFPEE